MILIGKKIENL